jgi:hypothetical protein
VRIHCGAACRGNGINPWPWYRISNHHPPPDPLVQGVDDYFIYDTIEGLNSNLFAVSQSAEYSEQGADIHFTHLAS